MFRLLLKKELLELNAWLFRSRKTGRFRSKGSAIGYFIFFGSMLLFLTAYFFVMAFLLIGYLNKKDCAWLGFAIMSLMSVMLGVFGSVFSTYEAIYRARDNELLLSMPIPPSAVLLSKMFGVYLMGLLYLSTAMIPTLIIWWTQTDFGFFGVLFPILLYLALSFFVLVLTCVLGFLVAKVASRVRNRNFFTVVTSLLFFAGYYYICLSSYKALRQLVDHTDEVRELFRSYLYPFYIFGRAAEGHLLLLLLVILVVGGLTVLLVYIMSRTFVRIATTNRGDKKRFLRGSKVKEKSVPRTLLFREWRRLISSPTYLLNCAVSSLIMIAAGLFLLLRGNRLIGTVNEVLEIFPYGEGLKPVLVFFLVSLMASTNTITAPSVSLEGKTLWILRSIPLDQKKVLRAKLALHELVTGIPALFTAISAALLLRTAVLPGVLAILSAELYIMLMDRFGLLLNLKMPNLDWKNEAIPVKQSLPVFITLFSGWTFSALFTGPSVVFLVFTDPSVYLAVVSGILLVLVLLTERWISRKGAGIFEEM